jgi:hypothetical protein
MAEPAKAARVASPTKPLAPAPMVGWYDPGQLARTAVEVLVSTIFGRHADHRLVEALDAHPDAFHDYTQTEDGRRRESMWIDYAADVGDGWDSTYAVAYFLAQERLRLRAPDEREHDTERGQVLVFGGDQVYPTASRGAYQRRLVTPYEAALAWTDAPHPHAFAVPGNHDWYDSLVSFSRLFCSSRWLGGWQTRQARSYFALKLPHGWWLLGTDVQLDSDIDRPQVEYFELVAKQMAQSDRVILCNAEPHWIYAGVYGTQDADYTESNLAFLERTLGRRVSVFLAGDLHHYRRHEAPDGTQKITAGGGGAFLHPTHRPDVSTLSEKDKDGRTRRVFTCRASFPDPATSRRLAWRNLLFPFLNPWFGQVPAVLYLLTAWVVMADIGHLGLTRFGSAVLTTLHDVALRPAGVFWTVAVFAGFWLFTDTHSRVYRWSAGTIHGLAHVAATFFVGWAAAYLAVTILGLPFRSPGQLAISAAVMLVGGYFVGAWIMGIYLLVSLNGFGRHSNEAFSSLHIAGWKSFLRLRIDRDGTLTIFPVGIRRVPRRWAAAGTRGAVWAPSDRAATPPRLIEAPIIVNGRPTP